MVQVSLGALVARSISASHPLPLSPSLSQPRGWTYDDLVYVSQKALDECAAGLKTTVEGVSDRVQNVKAEVLQRLFNMEESLEGKIEDGQRECVFVEEGER